MIFIVFRRSKSLNEYDEFDDDDDYFDNENSYVNWERHEECYEEFIGYDEYYDGRPTGYLTSFLPDGTSVSPKKVQNIKSISCQQRRQFIDIEIAFKFKYYIQRQFAMFARLDFELLFSPVII